MGGGVYYCARKNTTGEVVSQERARLTSASLTGGNPSVGIAAAAVAVGGLRRIVNGQWGFIQTWKPNYKKNTNE